MGQSSLKVAKKYIFQGKEPLLTYFWATFSLPPRNLLLSYFWCIQLIWEFGSVAGRADHNPGESHHHDLNYRENNFRIVSVLVSAEKAEESAGS